MPFALRDVVTERLYVNPMNDDSWLAGEGDVPRTYKSETPLKAHITKRRNFWGEMLPKLNADPQKWANTWGSTRAHCHNSGEDQVKHILDREYVDNYGMEIVEVEIHIVQSITVKVIG